MDTIQILKKSWELLWRYRALWLFGFLLALTAGSSLWLGLIRDNENLAMHNRIILMYTTIYFPGEGVTIDFRSPGGPTARIDGLGPMWYRDLSNVVTLSDVRALLISIGILISTSILLTVLFRYTSEAALIRMVDENERSNKMVTIRGGLRLGWSRVAGKLFLIDLSITLPVALIFALLFLLAISPLFLFGLESTNESLLSILGVSLLALVGLSLFCILVIAIAAVPFILRPVMRRTCAVDGLGVGASIRQGFSLLKTCFRNVIITGLVSLAIKVTWAIVSIPAMIILSPVILLTMAAGIVISAVPALLIAGIASLFVNTVFALIIGIIFSVPLFILVAFSPAIFLSGLVEVFQSSFWTLSYREFRPLANVSPQPVNPSEPVGLMVAPVA
jgi:hypothetical protein